MPYHLTCDCGRLFVVPESQKGSAISCPRCGRMLTPKPEFETPPPPPLPMPLELPSPPPLPTPLELPFEESDGHSGTVGRSRFSEKRFRQGVSLIALGIVIIALISLLPLYVEIWLAYSAGVQPRFERWAFLILGVGILQVAYSVYLYQLPDWSTAWAVSAATLCIATGYATLIGVRLLAKPDNSLVRLLELDGNRYTSAQEAGWCFIMLLMTATLSYFTGRFGFQWHRNRPT